MYNDLVSALSMVTEHKELIQVRARARARVRALTLTLTLTLALALTLTLTLIQAQIVDLKEYCVGKTELLQPLLAKD